MTPLHQAALNYAARGMPVFPCRPGTKKPATEHGYKDASCDPDQINAWWEQGDYNIGTEPAKSGWCVIDVDDKNGHEGSKVWAALCPDMVETLMVRTPSNGTHIYYKGVTRSNVGKLGDGLDIRSEDGYVLLPPSVVNGRLYQIAHRAEIAPLPAWIAEKLVERTREPIKAPEGVEVDPDGSEEWAVALIEATILQDGPPVVGASLNQRTVALAMRLGDGPQYGYTISEDVAVALMLDHWSAEDRIGEAVRNAYSSRSNPLGCGQPGSKSRKYDPDLGIQPYNPEPASVVPEEYEPPVEPGVTKRVGLVNGSNITMEKIDWLWPGWLAAGKFHVLGGQSGAGKSTITFSLLAQITVGGKWPDGSQAPLGDVLIWSGEDDIKDTILPRFVAAGGDVGRLWFPDRVSLSDGSSRHFDPAVDMAGLLADCRSVPALKVIVIDPIVSTSKGDSHKNAEARRDLQPIVDFAEETGAAVIGITHFTKGTQGRDPLERITGSLAFGALPRIVWGADKSEDEDEARRMVRLKSNIGRSGGGFEYTLQQVPVAATGDTAQRVAWGQPLTGSALELMGNGEDTGKQSAALAMLYSLLEPAGTAGVEVKALKQAAQAHGVSWATVERAKAKAGTIEAIKNIGGTGSPWSWRLVPPEV